MSEERERQSDNMLPQLGLAAGTAGWRAGHEAVRSGALTKIEDLEGTERNEHIAAYAAAPGRAYMRQVVEANGLTEAQGARIFGVYIYTFIRGAVDQALDGGALMQGH